MLYKHISEAVADTIKYIDLRRKNLETPLYTSKAKLNNAIDGFSWGRIYTIAGQSGSGKSLTIEELKRDFVDHNPTEKFDILSFEFEMLAIDQVARNLSGKVQKSVSQLFSANQNFLEEQSFNDIIEVSKQLEKYPIYYVDEVGTVNDIERTIYEFILNKEDPERGLIITIDHILE